MSIEFSDEFARAPARRPARGAAGAGRLLRRFVWGGCATAFALTLAAAGMPTFFALGGETLDPAATLDLSRAVAGLSLARKPTELGPRANALQDASGRRVETPAIAVDETRPAAASHPPAARPSAQTPPQLRVAHLIAPPSAFTAGRIADAGHGLDQPDVATASRFARALPPPEQVAAAALENEALAEAEVASRQPDVAAPLSQDEEIAALIVPKPTARPFLGRAADMSDEEDGDDEDAAPPRIAASKPRPSVQTPRVPATPRREAPSPVMAYARPDAGALRMDPSAVDAPSLRPKLGAGTAIYDISAATVYLPNGERLEAHSGLGPMRDNPRFVHKKNRGPTPPHTYKLTLRESLFHGVQAIRLTPVGGQGRIFNRVGLLAHTYMLGARGDSNGCVSFKDYKRFLAAYRRGEIRQLVVVERMDSPKSRFAWLFGKS